MRDRLMRIYDPLYGVVELTPLEYEILSSPELQRLRYVRMCNINSMLVTGASEISRFEHTLGVLKLAKIWLEHNGNNLSSSMRQAFSAAALLHDFKTGPFGHSLQYVFEDNENKFDDAFEHDNLGLGAKKNYHSDIDALATFCGRPFSSKSILGDRVWSDVSALIRGEGIYGPLIAGTIDLDNIDNVIRLAYHVGIAETKDAEIAIQLAKDILPSSTGELEVSEKCITHIENWQRIRSRLYELLLLDWAEFSAKAMLTRIMELAVENDILAADSWLHTDLEFLYMLESIVGEAQEIATLTKRLRCGDLYYPVSLLKTPHTLSYEMFSDVGSKRELENQLRQRINTELKSNFTLIIHPILDKKKTDRAIAIKVRESGESVIIGRDSHQLLLGVFLDKKLLDEKKESNCQRIIKSFFEELQLSRLSNIEDPMADGSKGQFELL